MKNGLTIFWEHFFFKRNPGGAIPNCRPSTLHVMGHGTANWIYQNSKPMGSEEQERWYYVHRMQQQKWEWETRSKSVYDAEELWIINVM